MKILYVSQYFPPEMGAPAARVSELSRYWVEAGHQVTVLTGFPNHPAGVLLPEYRRKFRRLVWNEELDGINVVRSWLLPFANRKPVERILNYSSFFFSSCLTGLFLERPDVIIGTSPQLLVGLTAWWLSRFKRTSFVFEVRDLWPDTITASGIGRQESLLIRSIGALSRFLYQSCQHLVVVSPAYREELVTKWGVCPTKISVVENGVETDLFIPGGDTEDVKGTLGLQGKFVVAYIGTLGAAHGLSTMLQAAALLQTALSDAVFLLVGEGADKDRLLSLARVKGLNNIRFIPQQPRVRIPSIIRSSDICLVPLKKADAFKTVIPTKMLEFMACGRPIILGVDGQARRILEEARAGIPVEPENAEALAKAIRQLYSDSGLRLTLGRNGRHYIVNRLSRKKTAEQYSVLLETVVGDAKRARLKHPR